MNLQKPAKLILALFLSLVIFLPVSAFAFRVGDVDTKVGVGGGVSYDDNVTYAPDNRINDVITNLIFGFVSSYEGKNTLLNMTGDVTRHIFSKNSSFSNTSEDFSLTLKQELSKYDRVEITDQFTHAEEPNSFEDAFGRTSGRYAYYQNRGGINYTRDITKQWSFTGKYFNQQNEYTRKDLLDSYLNTYGLETNYFITSTTGILAAYSFTKRQFKGGPDVAIHNVSGGFKQYFSSQVYLDGRAGIDFIRSYNGAEENHPAFSLALTDEFDENSRAVLSFSKQYQASSYSEDLFNSWQTSLAFNRQLMERLGGSLALFYGEGEYSVSKTKDTSTGANTILTYDIKDLWQVKLSYLYARTSSNVHSRDYTKNLISLSFTGRF